MTNKARVRRAEAKDFLTPEARDTITVQSLWDIVEDCDFQCAHCTQDTDKAYYKKLKKACVRVLGYFGE